MGAQDGVLTFDEALLLTEPMALQPISKPIIVDKPQGDLNIGDLPLAFLNEQTSGYKYWVDVEENVHFTDEVKQIITELANHSRYVDFPPPFGPKNMPLFAFTMQLFVVRKPDSENSVL